MKWLPLLSSARVGDRAARNEGTVRSAFERDIDRVIFSHPFRRMQDKTQVHPLPKHDFVHNRLTHSLEVSSIGRSLGKKVGKTVVDRHPELSDFSAADFGSIVAAAALAHDVGNPPFGHGGEKCLSDFFIHTTIGQQARALLTEAQWADMISFEGNAQGFRILNKAHYQGLRLTYGTLGAFTKYPCASNFTPRDPHRASEKKYGFFQTERTLFKEMAERLELDAVGEQAWARHPLAFLVEAADDICYSIIDMEDGCRLGLVGFDETVALFAEILGERFDRRKLDLIYGQNEKVGALRALVIDQLIIECAEVFLTQEDAILGHRFDRPLTECCRSAATLQEISRLSCEKIYHASHVVEMELGGYTALHGLLKEFVPAGLQHLRGALSSRQVTLMRILPDEIRAAIEAHATIEHAAYGILRNIMDFISGLTDNHVLSLYRKMKAYPPGDGYGLR